MRKIEASDIIIWVSLITIIIWIIAKLTGLINTPEWLNLFPIISFVFFAGAFYQKILSFMDKMYVRTNYFKHQIDNINKKLDNHEDRLNSISTTK